jgi:hypothetical protein
VARGALRYLQLTELNQKVGDSVLVEEPGKPLDPSKLWKPTK